MGEGRTPRCVNASSRSSGHELGWHGEGHARVPKRAKRPKKVLIQEKKSLCGNKLLKSQTARAPEKSERKGEKGKEGELRYTPAQRGRKKDMASDRKPSILLSVSGGSTGN